MIIKTTIDETKFEYYESLRGETALGVNGVQLIKMSKKIFLNEVDGERTTYAVIGNRFFGYSLVTDDDDRRIPLSRNTWYDWVFLTLPIVGIFASVFFGMTGGILGLIFNLVAILTCGLLIRSRLSSFKRIIISILVIAALNFAWFSILTAIVGGIERLMTYIII